MNQLKLAVPAVLSHLAHLWPDLAQLPAGLPAFSRLVSDSRKVQPGDLFLGLPGSQQDGRAYFAQAASQGAGLLLGEGRCFQCREYMPGCWQIDLPDLQGRLGAMLQCLSATDVQAVRISAVTGTNGKSSIAHYLTQAWRLLGHKATMMGTLGYGPLDQLQPASHTTPDLLTVYQLLQDWQQQGVTRISLEASSHALDQGRLAGLPIQHAIFTNLTRDHLDYHTTLEAYAAAKRRLFSWPGLQQAIINQDDPLGRSLLDTGLTAACFSYSLQDASADLYADRPVLNAQGMRTRLVYRQQDYLLQLPFLGRFNLANLLAVAGVLLTANLPAQQVFDLLPQLQPVPGRMQRLPAPAGLPQVVVDYAHTPDALRQALTALREHCNGKLWCVFGCGGNRDTGKRPIMGQLAAELADRVVVTDDNPRFESASRIRRQILAAAPGATEVADRRTAIEWAITQAGAGDCILLAGKGHEDYQEIEGVRHWLDDAAEARQALQRRQEHAG